MWSRRSRRRMEMELERGRACASDVAMRARGYDAEFVWTCELRRWDEGADIDAAEGLKEHGAPSTRGGGGGGRVGRMGTFCAVDVDVDVEGKMGITPDLRTDSDARA
jgi:hypothetical protein